MNGNYDVIILGAGPAGLSAGIYAGRARLSTLIIGKDGGQITSSEEIENYPGQVLINETGTSLITRMTEQCKKFGVECIQDVVTSITLEGSMKKVVTSKQEFCGKTIIIATGAHARPIGCKREQEFIGTGISYCATCDANFFEGLEVFVVGGGDAAVEEAIYLTKFARKVTIIHRRDQLRAAKSIQEKAMKNPKISFIWDSVVEEVGGEGILSEIVVKNVKTEERTTYKASAADGVFGLFGFVGTIPNTELFENTTLVLNKGYIPTDEEMHTNIDGVFAAGDVRVKGLRQVVTAVADGAIAATQAEHYIENF